MLSTMTSAALLPSHVGVLAAASAGSAFAVVRGWRAVAGATGAGVVVRRAAVAAMTAAAGHTYATREVDSRSALAGVGVGTGVSFADKRNDQGLIPTTPIRGVRLDPPV